MGSTAITGGKYDTSRSPAENAETHARGHQSIAEETVNFKDWKIGSNNYRFRKLEPDSPSNCRKGRSSTYVPTHADIWLRIPKTGSSVRNGAGRGIIEAHGGSASLRRNGMKQHGRNQPENPEQRTADRRRAKACVIRTQSPQRKRNSASRSATSTRIRTTTPWSTTSTRTDTSPCKP